MGKTAEGLAEFCKSKIGTSYVYGTKGEVLTEDKYNSLKSLYGSKVWDSDKTKIGKVCCDCSGLISWYTGIIRSSVQYKNLADHLYPISTINEAPIGSAVWKQGHIGVYIGNGKYIAEDGSYYNCRENYIKDSSFTHWFRIADIEYVDEDIKTIEIILNGKKKTVSAINKDGYNYVKLRDLADERIIISYDEINKIGKVDVI